MREPEQEPTYNPTWEEWERDLLDAYDTSKRYEKGRTPTWLALDHWLYPTKENGAYGKDKSTHVVYHVCKKNYERNYKASKIIEGRTYSSIAPLETGCQLCGEQVLDGFKMIMMLERL